MNHVVFDGYFVVCVELSEYSQFFLSPDLDEIVIEEDIDLLSRDNLFKRLCILVDIKDLGLGDGKSDLAPVADATSAKVIFGQVTDLLRSRRRT